MSASLLSPLPITTPRAPASSFSLRAAAPWGAEPFPRTAEILPVGKIVLPKWPDPAFQPQTSPSPKPPALGPIPATSPSIAKTPAFAVFQPLPSEPPPAPSFLPYPAPAPAPPFIPVIESVPEPSEPFVPVSSLSSPPPAPAPPPDFTDADLREALAPLFSGFSSPRSHDDDLEPLLRATIRRALAEYSPTGRPFQPPSALDRFKWRMQALFSSRTYEDILFEKTHRFQVEEVFLVDAATLALVSYASSNPGRHASPRRVESTVKRLAHQAVDAGGNLLPSFKLPDDRNVVTCPGSFITLFAIVRGKPTEMALADLAFSLGTIEDRFRERFHTRGSPLLKILQPFLEDCLLIQSPASAA